MALTEIVSQSGTIHYVNPKPRFYSQGARAIGATRTQTLCEMHLKYEGHAGTRQCAFCAKAAGKLESF